MAGTVTRQQAHRPKSAGGKIFDSGGGVYTMDRAALSAACLVTLRICQGRNDGETHNTKDHQTNLVKCPGFSCQFGAKRAWVTASVT